MITNKYWSMECPHCYLEMQSSLQSNEVSKCPKCEYEPLKHLFGTAMVDNRFITIVDNSE